MSLKKKKETESREGMSHPKTHTHHTPHTHTTLWVLPPSLPHILRSMSVSIKSNQMQCSDTVSAYLPRDSTALEAANMPICYYLQNGVHQIWAFCKRIKE